MNTTDNPMWEEEIRREIGEVLSILDMATQSESLEAVKEHFMDAKEEIEDLLNRWDDAVTELALAKKD